MATEGSLSSHFLHSLLCLWLLINFSLAYLLKNCTIIYEENPSADVSLDCTNRKLVSVPDDLPKDVVSTKLNNNMLEKIYKKDFCGMSKLRNLNLSNNEIDFVDNEAFISLVSLKTLDMKHNQIPKLMSHMFQGLSNLTMLDLSENFIRFINYATFQFLTSLEAVNLASNSFSKITGMQVLLQLPKIQSLDLCCTLLPSFDTKDLPLNLSSNLKELCVPDQISISTSIFPHLKKLEYSVCNSYSSLKWDIPDKTLLKNITHLFLNERVNSFEGMHQILQSLDSLSHLRLNYWLRNTSEEWIETGLLSVICHTPTLRKLDLFYQHLDKMTYKLAPCFQLRELDLSRTWITDLSKGSIQSMKHLWSLNVSHNQLTKVPYDIRSLASLKILNMNDNFISELGCEDFMNTTFLTELSLNTNRVAKLERCVVEHLIDLKVLDLSNNMLLTFKDTFKMTMTNLEVLDISQNSMTVFDNKDFQGLKSLKHLNLASNVVEKIKQNTFHGLNSLEDLTASFLLNDANNLFMVNQLKNLSIYLTDCYTSKFHHLDSYEGFPVFKSLKNLTVACSSHGYPYYLPTGILEAMKHLENFKAINVYINPPDVDMFSKSPQLKSLALITTDLSDMDSKFFLPISNLRTLDFSESKLKSLDFLAQTNLTALRYLKITDSEISVVNETIFNSLPSLTYLDLSNNPFTCECSNADFIQWIKSNKQTQVVNAYQYKCSFPVEKQGTLLLDSDFQSCWNNGSFYHFLSSTCLVLLTLLTSFIYHFLRWQLDYTFHLFLAFFYDSRRRKTADPHQFDAFVSYNVHDEDWVYREMLPVLEGEQGWRLCLHHRDFQPGKPIMENITEAIYGSRKTICVISRHYLQSEWCSREIQLASFRLFDEQKDVLILLFLEDIPSRHLSPYYRMRKLVKKRTYLSWPQAAQHPGVFWQNVQRALQTGDALTENTDLLTGPAGPAGP